MPHQLSIPGKSKPYLLAHRGSRAVCPENTLAAFQRAIADRADILETDLHLSKDGVFVCIHDDTVDRTTDGTGPVNALTLAELKSLDAAGGQPEFAGERLPTLANLAEILPPDVFLALELKTDDFLTLGTARQLVDELTALEVRDRTVVLSFSMQRLQSVRAVAPDILTGWITMRMPFPVPGVDLVGPFWPLLYLNPLYVWIAHRRGQLVTPLDPTPDNRLPTYLSLGCDAILTDDPGKTRQELARLSGYP
jgi:glycerophosphoryl diester phosphodiesterase